MGVNDNFNHSVYQRDTSATGGSWIPISSVFENGILTTAVPSSFLLSGGADFGIVYTEPNKISSASSLRLSNWYILFTVLVALAFL